MYRWVIAALLCSLEIGCVGRTGIYAPRLVPTVEHREATDNPACLACHDVGTLTSHAASDDCRGCHTLCRGC